MGKIKLLLVVALAAVFVLALAAPAMATTHGNYSTTTDACAGCHVAHAAQAPKLLKVGPTQTEFCYLCHGQGTTAAPYDIQYGLTSGDPTNVNSTAGGFEKLGGSGGATVTSRHTVWGYDADANGAAGSWSGEATKTLTVPGGTQNLTGNGLVCGSCHNPHAGGTGAPNPRLLRTTILGSSNLTVEFTLEPTGVTDGYQVTEYVSGSTAWCGACHDKFDKPDNSGHELTEGDTMYRHAMDMAATLPGGADGTIASGTPLETHSTDPDKVACLTCHRAHGTTATVSGYALSWPRDNGGTGTTSALLRMQNRGVCYNCHGAAEYNKP
ncbi:MAG: hypothetical protein D9V47_09555 [Clostridia bacterium]|nr:MAG: hypothetical protein D9V47_09555 [Clostridia bacterium]